jgi:predicted RNA-binding Zn ribbon-like protein
MTPANQGKATAGEGLSLPRFVLIGKRLCIDFANTASPAEQEGRINLWRDLVDFLLEAGVVAPARGGLLKDLDASAPEATAAALALALRLRSAIREALARVGSAPLPQESIAPINAVLRLTEGYDQLVQGDADDPEWRLDYVMRQQRVEWLLAAIARSAAELLAEGPRAPIRKCAGPACALYFYDTSRTGRRRWCSMAVCGNRNKVAAFARRAAARMRVGHRKKQPAGPR